MTAKMMSAPLAINDVGTVFTNLFVTRPGAPKDAAKIFTEALDLHIRELFEKRLQAKASEILAHERATPAWTAEHKPGGGVGQAVADGARFKHETLARPEMLSSTAGAKPCPRRAISASQERHMPTASHPSGMRASTASTRRMASSGRSTARAISRPASLKRWCATDRI